MKISRIIIMLLVLLAAVVILTGPAAADNTTTTTTQTQNTTTETTTATETSSTQTETETTTATETTTQTETETTTATETTTQTETETTTATETTTQTETETTTATTAAPENLVITASVTQVTDSLKISYSGTATSGTADSWNWIFGDGNTSTSQTGTFYYSSPGNYTITLTATNTDTSQSDTDSTTVLFPQPIAYFTLKHNNQTGSAPLFVEFEDESEENPYTGYDLYRWQWDLDGDGDYDYVAFSSEDDDPDTEFTYDEDGNYTVKLRVTDENYQSNTYEMEIVVDSSLKPTADFAIGNTYSESATGSAPFTARFYDQSEVSEESESEIDTWVWKIYDEDGTLRKQVSKDNPEYFEYEFTMTGIYTVSLTVTDEDGNSDTEVKEDCIEVTLDLSATFTGSPTSGTLPLAVGFDAVDGSGNEYDIVKYYWTFGDGYTGLGKEISHTYTSAGTYNVKLTVTDEEGNTYSYNRDNYITVYDGTAAVTEETIALANAPSSSDDLLFGIPGTELLGGEVGWFDDIFGEYIKMLTGIFGF